MKKRLTFIDMFAGIGGFRSGMEQAGHKCVGWIEWDKFARQSYEAMYDTEGEYNAKDIQQVKGSDLPGSDVWCFGFPCQDVSVAGKQKGIQKGTRSGLFFEIIRLLEERIENSQKIPEYLFVENVKNLLSIDGGWGFARVQIEMDKVGYDTEWCVLNSSDVVPQNRERVYIVGHLRGASTRKVFPIQRQGGTYDQKRSGLNVLGNYGTNPKKHISERTRVFADGKAPTLQATDYKQPRTIAVNQVGNIIDTKSFGGNPQVGRVYGTDGLAPTLNTMQGGGREPKVLVRACLTPDREKKRQNGRRIKNDGEPSFTITSADRQGVAIEKVQPKEEFGRLGKQATVTTRPEGLKTAILPVTDNLRIRKLTPLECWRLQGFTDEQFYKAKDAGVSNSQLYKQAGNSVTVPVIKAIAERMVIK